MRTPVIPECFNGLPNSTKLYRKDVLSMFGYSKNTTVINEVNSGYLPEPNILKGLHYKKLKHYWTLGSIRRLRVRLIQKQKSRLIRAAKNNNNE